MGYALHVRVRGQGQALSSCWGLVLALGPTALELGYMCWSLCHEPCPCLRVGATLALKYDGHETHQKSNE